VREAIAAADCLIGARRMLDRAAPGQKRAEAVAPERIVGAIRARPECARFAVLMSGDTGFFSGAKKLLPLLAEAGYAVETLPGLSSLSCLCARLGTSYEDVVPVSLHGRERDIAADLRRHGRVFVLTGGENGAGALCRRLAAAGLGQVRASVGEKLGYPDERVSVGSAAELAGREFDSLSAVLLEHDAPDAVVTPGLPDSAFQRAEGVPMTKSEIRALALSKLALTGRAVCWDVGAGTGSVSVEMALLARHGTVCAIERGGAALGALGENLRRFGLDNARIVPGAAPEVCGDLPAPSHVFLGGTGGRAREIIALVLEKNPAARIVAAAVTLETAAELTACLRAFHFAETEAVSLTVARDRKAGPYHLMRGQNPVYLFTMAGGGGG
ncbi:MAG: precorrin-6y C5,15-methyltransferase (decarboxylating) subunit CbiE, partial [Oscillospiraceae bacterium]|nr:precorrin-6y C5,15-methyltransferase (decarboxylating) subunit CbiE [Oscillospiraceae bacterium]